MHSVRLHQSFYIFARVICSSAQPFVCVCMWVHALFIWQLASFLNANILSGFSWIDHYEMQAWNKKWNRDCTQSIFSFFFSKEKYTAYPLCSTFQFKNNNNNNSYIETKRNETKTIDAKSVKLKLKCCSAENQTENIPQHLPNQMLSDNSRIHTNRKSDGENSTWFICLMFVVFDFLCFIFLRCTLFEATNKKEKELTR